MNLNESSFGTQIPERVVSSLSSPHLTCSWYDKQDMQNKAIIICVAQLICGSLHQDLLQMKPPDFSHLHVQIWPPLWASRKGLPGGDEGVGATPLGDEVEQTFRLRSEK